MKSGINRLLQGSVGDFSWEENHKTALPTLYQIPEGWRMPIAPCRGVRGGCLNNLWATPYSVTRDTSGNMIQSTPKHVRSIRSIFCFSPQPFCTSVACLKLDQSLTLIHWIKYPCWSKEGVESGRLQAQVENVYMFHVRFSFRQFKVPVEL